MTNDKTLQATLNSMVSTFTQEYEDVGLETINAQILALQKAQKVLALVAEELDIVADDNYDGVEVTDPYPDHEERMQSQEDEWNL